MVRKFDMKRCHNSFMSVFNSFVVDHTNDHTIFDNIKSRFHKRVIGMTVLRF